MWDPLQGRIVEIYGREASGETTLALHVIKEAQKLGGAYWFWLLKIWFNQISISSVCVFFFPQMIGNSFQVLHINILSR